MKIRFNFWTGLGMDFKMKSIKLGRIPQLTVCTYLILWMLSSCTTSVDSRSIHNRHMTWRGPRGINLFHEEKHSQQKRSAEISSESEIIPFASVVKHRSKRPSFAGLDNIDVAITALEQRARSRNRGSSRPLGRLSVADLARLLQAG